MVGPWAPRSLVAVLLLATALAGCTDFGPASDGDLRPISAKEAEAIADTVALAWQPDARLAMLGAVDGGQSNPLLGTGGQTGFPFAMGAPGNLTLGDDAVDGRSIHWRAVYRSSAAAQGLSIAVIGNGTTWQEATPDAGPPSIVGEWTIDSVEALQLARSQPAFAAASQNGVAMVLVGDMTAGFNPSMPSAGDSEPLWYLMVEGAQPPVFAAVKARSGEVIDPLEMMHDMAGDYAEQEAGEAGYNYTHPDAESDPGGAPVTFRFNGSYDPAEPWNSESLIFEVAQGRSTIDVVFTWQAPTSVESAGYSLRESRGTVPELIDHAADEHMSGQNRTVEVRDTYAVDAPGTYHATLGEVRLSDFEARIDYQFVITVS